MTKPSGPRSQSEDLEHLALSARSSYELTMHKQGCTCMKMKALCNYIETNAPLKFEFTSGVWSLTRQPMFCLLAVRTAWHCPDSSLRPRILNRAWH